MIPHLRLVTEEPALVEPPPPAPRLCCATCGERVLSARIDALVLVLAGDHRCAPRPWADRAADWLAVHPGLLVLAGAVAGLAGYVVTGGLR